MITPEGINEMASAIVQANGISIELATEYANLIGDTPEIDGDRVVVSDEQGKEIARIILPLEPAAASS